MADDRLTTLYEWSEEMAKAGEEVKNKHEENYKTIIEYIKTSEDTKERILAAQIIARFFKYFPDYEESAFDSIVDLCESADVNVRKHATMAMIAVCRDCKHLVSKAADILIQLYQTNQASEVNLINQSLTTLLNLNIQKFLQSFFTNFEDGSEVVRKRALKFLSTKIQMVPENLLTKDIEEQLMTYSKKAMEDVTKDEFITFIGILSKLKIAKTATGQAMIVLVIKSQAELDKEFDPSDTDSLDKFLLCTKNTIPLLSQYNRASEYVDYICTKILPNLSKIGNDLDVLQALAEMSPYISEDDKIDLDSCQQIIFDKLLEYLPLPTDSQGVDFQFTHIEYLLFAFHQIARIKPESYFPESRLDSIKSRLQHLSQGCTKYTSLLSDPNLDNKLRSVALRTTKNISNIIKDLFKKPPQFKTVILLSCKPLTAPPVQYNKKLRTN